MKRKLSLALVLALVFQLVVVPVTTSAAGTVDSVYYQFNNGSDGTPLDTVQIANSSKDGYHGTAYGNTPGTYVDDAERGMVARLNATEKQGITANYYTLLDTTSSSGITIEGWIKPDALSGNQPLVSNLGLYSYNGFWMGIYDNTLYFQMYEDGIGFVNIGSTLTLTAGEWNYFAVTWTFGSPSVNFYIKPQGGDMLSETSTYSGSDSLTLTNNWLLPEIGYKTYLNAGYTGLIDDIRISNTNLALEDLLGYEAPPEPGLAQYILNEGANGTTLGTITDRSGNGNNATATGGKYADGDGPYGVHAELTTADGIAIPALNLEAGLTFEAIVKASDGVNGVLYSGGVTDSNGFYINLATGLGKARMGFTAWGSTGWMYMIAGENSPAFEFDQWTYIAIAWEADTSVVTFYTMPIDTGIVTSTTIDFETLGGGNGGSGPQYGGVAPTMIGDIATFIGKGDGGITNATGIAANIAEVRVIGKKLAQNGLLITPDQVHYTLNEGANGTALGTITDQSGNGNNATAAGGKYADGDGPYGVHAELTTADGIAIPALNLEAGLTFEAVVKASDGVNGVLYSGGVSDSNGFYINLATGLGKARMGFTAWGSTGWMYMIAGENSPAFEFDQWTYIAIAWEADTSVVTFYTMPIDTGIVTSTTIDFETLGGGNGGSGPQYGGVAPTMIGDIATFIGKGDGGITNATGIAANIAEVRVTGTKLAENNLLVDIPEAVTENSVYYRFENSDDNSIPAAGSTLANVKDENGGSAGIAYGSPAGTYTAADPVPADHVKNATDNNRYIRLDAANEQGITIDSLEMGGGITFEAWVYVDSLAQKQQLLAAGNTTDGITIGINTDGGLYIEVYNSGTRYFADAAAWRGSVKAGQWYYVALMAAGDHVEFRYKPVGGAIAKSSGSISGNPGFNASFTDIKIGYTTSGGFTGYLDEIRLSGSELVDSELLVTDVLYLDYTYSTDEDFAGTALNTASKEFRSLGALPIGPGFTFEGWVKPTAPGEQLIFSRAETDNNGNLWGGVRADGALYIYIRGNGDTIYFESDPGLVKWNKWNYIGISYVRDNLAWVWFTAQSETGTFYHKATDMKGENWPAGGFDFNWYPFQPNDDPVRIGYNELLNKGFTGQVGKVRISNYAVSRQELLLPDHPAKLNAGVTKEMIPDGNDKIHWNLPTFGSFNQTIVEINGVYYGSYQIDAGGSVQGNNNGQGVVVYSLDRGVTWQKLYTPDTSYSSPPCLAADKDGNLYIGGFGWGKYTDFYLIKYDSNRNKLWEKEVTGCKLSTKFGMIYSEADDCLYMFGRDHGTFTHIAEVTLDGEFVASRKIMTGSDHAAAPYFDTQYTTLYSDAQGRLHFAYTVYEWPGGTANEYWYNMLQVGYVYSDDRGVTWHDRKGNLLNTPYDVTSDPGAVVAVSGGQYGSNVWSSSIIENDGIVHILISSANAAAGFPYGGPINHMRIDRDTGDIIDTKILSFQYTQEPILQMHSNLSVDPETGYIYIASVFMSRPAVWESKDNGATWALKAMSNRPPTFGEYTTTSANYKITSQGDIILFCTDQGLFEYDGGRGVVSAVFNVRDKYKRRHARAHLDKRGIWRND